jgi:hypothetical protein
MLLEKRPAHSAVATALLMRRHAKVFKKGGMDFDFHTFCKIAFASEDIALAPCGGKACGCNCAK